MNQSEKMRRFPPSLPSLLALALSGILPATASDFDAAIRPLLLDRCVRCHGPEKDKADLRLDAKPHAFRGGESGAVIKPGESTASLLYQRISSTDENERMPPEGSPLSPAELAAVREWIDSGAVWPENDADRAAATDPRLQHWAFQPIRSDPAPPDGIDGFITARLAAAGLAPSPEADRRTLLRRLHLSVTGLAPTAEEIRTFETDPDPHAYGKRVDALLASPHYGEKWARHWLDVVRFADSHGFETNHERSTAWRYRDYVIAAFNEDKPYDRFLSEQIAGDTLGEDAATGFLVAGPWDRVKGQDKNLQLMQRADELSDIVNATGTAFLGMTLVCAKCHHHKFDPIPQTDFFALEAVFAGVQHGERPLRSAADPENQREAGELRDQFAAVETRLAAYHAPARTSRSFVIDDDPSSGDSVATLRPPASATPVSYDPGTGQGQADDPGDATRFPNFAASYRHFREEPGTDCFAWIPKAAGTFRIWLSWGVWPSHAPDARYLLDRDGDPATTDDQTEIASIDQRLFADGSPALPGERRWSGFQAAGVHALTPSSRILLRTGTHPAPTVADLILLEEADGSGTEPTAPHLRPPVTHLANTERFDPVPAKFLRFRITASSSAEPCLDELEVFEAGPSARNLALASAGTKATSGGDYPANEKHRLAHVHDGRYGNSHSWIARQAGSGGWVQLEFPATATIDRVVWSRDRGTGGRPFEDRLATGYAIDVSTDGTRWQTVASSADRLSPVYRKKVFSIPTVSGIPPGEAVTVGELRRTQSELAARIASLSEVPMAYAGQFKQPQPTRRLHRGDFLSPREVVAPDALSVFRDTLGTLGLPPDAPEQERRVAFARWLTDPRNPLPARVMANRVWHSIFGTGIVATPSDFGLMGFLPTHPELLDWLATEFIRSGWSVKHLQRLILTSATFRQSSRPVPAALEADATTALLWRFPPRRLDAELIRDNILLATGTLNLTRGGPGFLLFQPNANYARNWIPRTEGFDREHHRRMIYALKLRMEPDAIFAAFDIPDSGQVCPSRARSTTPLQALNLFNSGFLLEQAAVLAEHATQRGGPSLPDQIRAVFELAYGRSPEPDEAADALALASGHGLPALCRALLNSNEFLFLE